MLYSLFLHRYVNFARSKDEANLLAVQYKSSILFHCCRVVQTGDELTVWPSSKLRAHLSKDWSDVLSLKMSRTGSFHFLNLLPKKCV